MRSTYPSEHEKKEREGRKGERPTCSLSVNPKSMCWSGESAVPRDPVAGGCSCLQQGAVKGE